MLGVGGRGWGVMGRNCWEENGSVVYSLIRGWKKEWSSWGGGCRASVELDEDHCKGTLAQRPLPPPLVLCSVTDKHTPRHPSISNLYCHSDLNPSSSNHHRSLFLFCFPLLSPALYRGGAFDVLCWGTPRVKCGLRRGQGLRVRLTPVSYQQHTNGSTVWSEQLSTAEMLKGTHRNVMRTGQNKNLLSKKPHSNYCFIS